MRVLSFLMTLLITFPALPIVCPHLSHAEPAEKDVLAVMKKVTDFMMNTVSNRGGFVWKYTEDMSTQWGEIPARPSQIWVQGATCDVGMMLIDAGEITGDPEYLHYADLVARVLIRGQHPAGGWHYFIDFDMAGIPRYYDDIASKCWGWEEYYHYYGNCTFDDDVTASATRFLLRLYTTTLDPAYRVPLDRALDFILAAQFPNGAWPQRYPLRYDYPHDGHPDYTSYYTFNDGVIINNIMLLLEAYKQLGNEFYLEAARRGMDFVVLSQGSGEQAGWALQYSHDMQPAAARSYEPAAYNPGVTRNNIRALMTFYRITGDRRYLRGIPSALDWLERSKIDEPTGRYTHATWYEPVTNRPLYVHRTGTSRENGHYYVDYEYGDFICHYGQVASIDVVSLEREYRRVSALSPEEAMAEYARDEISRMAPPVDDAVAAKLIAALDTRGAWITDVVLSDYANPCSDRRGRTIRGIATREYVNNMHTLINWGEGRKP